MRRIDIENTSLAGNRPDVDRQAAEKVQESR